MHRQRLPDASSAVATAAHVACAVASATSLSVQPGAVAAAASVAFESGPFAASIAAALGAPRPPALAAAACSPSVAAASDAAATDGLLVWRWARLDRGAVLERRAEHCASHRGVRLSDRHDEPGCAERRPVDWRLG